MPTTLLHKESIKPQQEMQLNKKSQLQLLINLYLNLRITQ